MNHYGQLAERYWMDWLPTRISTMQDPDRFFTELGEQVRAEIDRTVTAMTARAPANLTPGELEGWASTARLMAEEKVLAELVYLPPETDPDDDEEIESPEDRDFWPDAIIRDVIQESYDQEEGQALT